MCGSAADHGREDDRGCVGGKMAEFGDRQGLAAGCWVQY